LGDHTEIKKSCMGHSIKTSIVKYIAWFRAEAGHTLVIRSKKDHQIKKWLIIEVNPTSINSIQMLTQSNALLWFNITSEQGPFFSQYLLKCQLIVRSKHHQLKIWWLRIIWIRILFIWLQISPLMLLSSWRSKWYTGQVSSSWSVQVWV
jgi:hypothetical protein